MSEQTWIRYARNHLMKHSWQLMSKLNICLTSMSSTGLEFGWNSKSDIHENPSLSWHKPPTLERFWILVVYHHDVKLQYQMSPVFWHWILVTKYQNNSCQFDWIYPQFSDLDDCYCTFPLPRSFFQVPRTVEWNTLHNPEVFYFFFIQLHPLQISGSLCLF